MRGTAWVCSLFAVCLAGCDVPQETIDDFDCTDLCRCISTLPSSQARCKAACLAQFAPISTACDSCIARNASTCSAMESECLPICEPPATPLEGDPP
jgi:hypothetical protein